MRLTFRTLLILGVISLFATTAVAAEQRNAFIKAVITPPVWGMDVLTVSLEPDERLCKQAYGDNWQEACFISPGQYGSPANGVVLRSAQSKAAKAAAPATPPKGRWAWNSSSSLSFHPETPWPTGSTFNVDVSGLPLPAWVKLNTTALPLNTLPLSGQSEKGQVWIDPSVDGPRGVSFALRFTAPPDKAALERDLTVHSAASGLELGQTRLVWSEDGASCVVNIPVRKLADTDAVLNLSLPGVHPLWFNDAGRASAGTGDLTQIVTIPGKHTLFRVSSAELKLVRNSQLANEYQLQMKTSLRIPAKDLLAALKITALPAVQNPEATAPYRWTEAPVIAPADLAKAAPLKAELIGDPGTSGEPFVFRVSAAPGTYIHCALPAGFGVQGYALVAPWTAVFEAVKPESEVRFLQPGNVLTLTPQAGNNQLDILSSGVDTVRWRVLRIRPDRLNVLNWANEPFNDMNAMSDMFLTGGDAVEGEISLPKVKDGELTPRFSTLPVNELMRGGSGFMRIELLGFIAGKEVARAARLVLATDLGLLSKAAPDGSRDVFVCSLSSGLPVENAVVRVIGINGLPVAEARTNAEGKAALPSVRGLEREKLPTALVAILEKPGTQNAAPKNAASQDMASQDMAPKDMAWMSLEDHTRRVDYSRFPTQGQLTAPDNINAHVFGQRGLFRPGETVHFGMVLRRGDWKPLPADLPLIGTLYDPADRVVQRRTFTVGAGLAEYTWKSQESALTGRYRLDISTPDSGFILGSGAVRVEEFQPDTLEIRTEPLKAVGTGWLVTPDSASPASLSVTLRNLYGLPASNHILRGQVSVRPANLSFAGYEDFTFPDVRPFNARSADTATTELPEARTSESGVARIPLPLHTYAAGTLSCQVLVEGLEADGGRGVSTEQTFLVSPLSMMLGYRPHGAVTNLAFVPQNTQGGLEFVAVDSGLRRVAPGPFHFSVAERRYVVTLTLDDQGRYVYEELPVDADVSTATVELSTDAPFRWDMPTDKSGEFLLTVRDTANRVVARVPFLVAGNDDLRPALTDTPQNLSNAQMRLALDKTDYAPGDTVNLFVSAPYEGTGLITLERDRVYAHAWFRAPAGHSVHSLTIPESFEGRGYINVSMGRALTSPEIFLQPHSYAVAPLSVNAAGRDMGLKVQTAELTLPGAAITARLTAKHPGKALVFAVDEGVLQLTAFNTPNPLRYLLLDRALEVDTLQMFDLLMPGHDQLGKRLPAFGGDMAMAGGRFQNPFKRRGEPPLTWWSGIVDVPAEGLDVQIPVPDYYNGQVRVMVVGLAEHTVGSAQAQAIVRAPLVLSPQMPLMVAPGDEFEAGLVLHNTTNAPLTVTLKMDNDTHLAVKTGLPPQAELAPGAEVLLPLRLTSTDIPGSSQLAFRATDASGQEYIRTTGVSIRPASLMREEIHSGVASVADLRAGKVPLSTSRALFAYNAASSASISPTPLAPLRGMLRYLGNYPYSCVEQSLSRALPLVLLERRPALAAKLLPATLMGRPIADVNKETLERAITALRGAYRPYRGMSLWADDNSVDTLLTAYSGDYLLALREAGLTIPGDLSTSFFETLERSLDRVPQSLSEARAQAYGLWVLTRAGVITSQRLDSLWRELDSRGIKWNDDVTLSLVAGSYAVMNMTRQAETLLARQRHAGLTERTYGPMNELAAQALHVAVLSRHFPDRLSANVDALSVRLLEALNRSGSHSTFAVAQGARALLELSGTGAGAGAGTGTGANASFAGATLQCTAMQPGFPTAPAKSATADSLTDLLALDVPGCTAFSLKSNPSTPLYWELATDGYDRVPKPEAAVQGMEITRAFFRVQDQKPVSFTKNAKGISAEIAQGTVIRVELTARLFGNAASAEVVLADLLPGGFELVLNHPDDSVTLPTGQPAERAEDEYNGESSAGDAPYTRVDRREDRVIVHTSLETTPTRIVYHLRAVNRGTFALPAASAEGLYDRTLHSRTESGILKVQ